MAMQGEIASYIIFAWVLILPWTLWYVHIHVCDNCKSVHVLYPREIGPMGGAPYIGPRLVDGLIFYVIFEVSVSHLYAKECPGKLSTLSS